MNPRKKPAREPDPVDYSNPFRQPRTIPTGWDVAAFYNPNPNETTAVTFEGSPQSSQPSTNESTKNTF